MQTTMPISPDPEILNGSSLSAILYGISLIIGTIGIPALVKNWKEIREMKYSKIAAKMEAITKKLEAVENELDETKDKLKTVTNIAKVTIPMLKLHARDNQEAMELIRIFELESGINLTPAG